MAESVFQSSKGSGSGGESAASGSAQGKASKSDSMLDIFTSEEDEESDICRLSKNLADVSIHSLLEQTKQVAEEIGCGR